MKCTQAALAAVCLLAIGGLPSFAQAVPAQPPQRRQDVPTDPQAIADEAVRFDHWIQKVPQGSGPFGTVREQSPTLPGHTIFRPANLGAVPGKLPIVSFANGGCRSTPVEFTGFLAELASRGYFIVAEGTNDVEFGWEDLRGKDRNGKPLQTVSRKVLTSAVDWAIAQNARAGSPVQGKLATDKIAYMGQSCGGMQALSASTDPRTTTTVVLNSGRFGGEIKAPGAFPEWFEWNQLHAPIAYFNGGPKDVQVSHDNYRQIEKLPVFLADLPVGHTGAYPGPDMRWVRAVVAWLDWQLKGNLQARNTFVGPHCGLCTNKDWTVTGSKNLK